jgi:hypothetical protein
MANVDYGEDAVDYIIEMTEADTEYALALPNGVKAIEIQAVEAVDIRHSFKEGVVASGSPYRTLKSGDVYVKELLWLNNTTLYVACGGTGKNVQVRAWF